MKRMLTLAVAGALAAPMLGGSAVTVGRSDDEAMLYAPSRHGRKGKGKGKQPHHRSRRFVAHDKRAALKARNRARA